MLQGWSGKRGNGHSGQMTLDEKFHVTGSAFSLGEHQNIIKVSYTHRIPVVLKIICWRPRTHSLGLSYIADVPTVCHCQIYKNWSTFSTLPESCSVIRNKEMPSWVTSPPPLLSLSRSRTGLQAYWDKSRCTSTLADQSSFLPSPLGVPVIRFGSGTGLTGQCHEVSTLILELSWYVNLSDRFNGGLFPSVIVTLMISRPVCQER